MSSDRITKTKPCIKCRLIMLFVAIVALGLGVFYGAENSKSRNLSELAKIQDSLTQSTLIPSGIKPLPEFKLNKTDGSQLTRDYFENQWTLVFFGFTHCPDICPTTLAHLRNVEKQLSAHSEIAKDTKVLFISVDPERDTPEQMNRYISYFSKNFDGATGSHEQLITLTRSIGVLYAKIDNPKNPDNYNVDHSAGIFLISPSVELRAILSHPEDTKALTADYIIIRESNQE